MAKAAAKTPDAQFDRLMNYGVKQAALFGARWCRWGWNGYRDIVQQGMGVVSMEPERTKTILLEAFRHQYAGGLALRGWNPVDEKPYSDSALWLVFTLTSYLKKTGDLAFLESIVPFYDGGRATVAEHIGRALDFLEGNKGRHGLLFIKYGDWNDSLTAVGKDDDGNSVGSHGNAEGRIFMETQAWGLISGAADAGRARRFIASCDEHVGRISSMQPGIAENGTVYSHVNIWMIQGQPRPASGSRAPYHRRALRRVGRPHILPCKSPRRGKRMMIRMEEVLFYGRRLLLEPTAGSSWASEMVLNPAMIRDPATGRIHMLFRATGPESSRALPGRPDPYPIFLGYGWSDDEGGTWRFDFSRPALAPALEYGAGRIFRVRADGKRTPDYANGSIEDPRLFFFEGGCYLTAACRMFPPGPYWVRDDPMQCAPVWAAAPENPPGRAASENVTVSVLFRVDLAKLARGAYEEAFTFVAPLTDPALGDDRDAVVFPERLNGRAVMLHRPLCAPARLCASPSILACAAPRFEELAQASRKSVLLASPLFAWERDRIGASAPPLRTGPGEWLLCYHGKQDAEQGYTQSFMLLAEGADGMPVVTHRCPERLFRPQEPWERGEKFTTPCLFVTGMLRLGDRLLFSYGAADERVGLAQADFSRLVAFVRRFPVR